MSNDYSPDEPRIYPHDKHCRIENALKSIECTIAFDVKDWSISSRDAWIYAVVFGWGDAIEEIAQIHHWGADDIERATRLHEQWETAKKWMEEHNCSKGERGDSWMPLPEPPREE